MPSIELHGILPTTMWRISIRRQPAAERAVEEKEGVDKSALFSFPPSAFMRVLRPDKKSVFSALQRPPPLPFFCAIAI